MRAIALPTPTYANVMSTLAVVIALCGAGIPQAGAAAVRAAFASNAGAVDGLSAAKTPKKGQLLALDAQSRFPTSVIDYSPVYTKAQADGRFLQQGSTFNAATATTAVNATTANFATTAATATNATHATSADTATNATSAGTAVTAATASDAQLLDGLNSTAFLGAGATAVNAGQLDGLDSTAFVLASSFNTAIAPSSTTDAPNSTLVPCYLGEVKLFAGNFAPKGTLFAHGQTLTIGSNADLFSLLGTTYGGDGLTTFALPDTHDLAPAGMNYVICTEFAGDTIFPELMTALAASDLATERFLVPHDELRRRAAALQLRLAAADIDMAVVQTTSDVLYVAGCVLDGWVLVPASGEPRVLARRAAERFAAETCWDVRRAVANKELVAELSALGVARGRIAVALDVVPAADYLKLVRGLPDAEFVDLTHHLRSVRAIKSSWELEHHRVAAEQVKDAMRTVAHQVVPGHMELDAQRLAEGCLRASGHQGVMRMRRFGGEMFFGQVCAAENSALPAALDAPLGGSGLYPSVGKGASTRELRAGDLLVLDLMGCHNGYLSDCTRVIAVGGVDTVPEDLLAAQAWCVATLETIAAAAKPGVAPSALYALALELAADAGHADHFMGVAPDQARFVGHGIGLEVDEYPFLARGFDEPLEAGMVFALEPKLVFPRRAAVGIEDAFVVTSDGVVPLPALPRDVLDLA